jgi:hypothetical protein
MRGHAPPSMLSSLSLTGGFELGHRVVATREILSLDSDQPSFTAADGCVAMNLEVEPSSDGNFVPVIVNRIRHLNGGSVKRQCQ